MDTQKINMDVIIAGYSGHAIVVVEALKLAGYNVIGYLNKNKVEPNFLNLNYFGFEKNDDVLLKIKGKMVFSAIGDNQNRKNVIEMLLQNEFNIPTVIHNSANVSAQTTIGNGTLICRGSNINPFVKLGVGVIVNTGAIIEHECEIGNYSHIAPGAVLCGNVYVGECSFIGANSVVKQGVRIGNNVTIGAGSVVLNDVESNSTIVGNPAKKISK